jgi:hypothetical protein
MSMRCLKGKSGILKTNVKDKCQSEFEGTQAAPSATQQQVSETLGLPVEDEVRCPKSGHFIGMLAAVHDSAPKMVQASYV